MNQYERDSLSPKQAAVITAIIILICMLADNF
jgi:hypothetical protein